MKQKVETSEPESPAENLQLTEGLGGKANYSYRRPEVIKEGSLPVLIAGGWSEGTASLQDTADEVLKDGREVITLDHNRSDIKLTSPDNDHPETLHRAETIMTILDTEQLGRVDVIAHSEGALDIELAARHYPNRFRNIILVAPAGMIGKDSMLGLLGRFSRKVARGYFVDLKEIKQRDPQSAKRFEKAGPEYFKANPKKGLREIGAIAASQIDQGLVDLRSKGIKIGLLQSHADRGFPDKKIYENTVVAEAINDSSSQDLQMVVDSYASVASKRAGHDDLIIHPERASRAALDMLSDLEKLDQ